MRPFALSQAQQHRLEKLSRDAGRSPAETLRCVLRDGFEFCEWEVRESLAGDCDARKRGAVRDGGPGAGLARSSTPRMPAAAHPGVYPGSRGTDKHLALS